jgi:hypothetical protein
MSATYDLHIGRKRTGVSIKPDSVWPKMWRIHQSDCVSDMVNLARAKDAAIGWARPRGLGPSEIARWHHRETTPEAAYSASGREAA